MAQTIAASLRRPDGEKGAPNLRYSARPSSPRTCLADEQLVLTVAAQRRHLVIIDGANAIYRAFFALPGLRGPDGSPTNAVLGFANMLGKVLREEAPDLIAVAFDPHGGSFRKRVFEGYKAGRDAQPEDLSVQFPVVRELIEAFNIPIIEVEDFEADDVIATVALQTPEDMRVTMISSDKDLMQLVSERVTLFDGIGDRRYEPADVEKRFGVPPSQMLDLRALIGDPSDNIPGVKGIGAKGAAKLISQWGTLEALLENAADVKAKRAREALQEQREEARLSKQLATLRGDVPLPLELEDLARRAADNAALRGLYERCGFTRLIEALDRSAGDAPAASPASELEIEVVGDSAQLASLTAKLEQEDLISVALVSGAGDVTVAPLVGIALTADPTCAAYVPLTGDGLAARVGLSQADALAQIVPLLGKLQWVASGSKRAQSLLAERGGCVSQPVADVEIAAFLLEPGGSAPVPALAQQWLGRKLPTWEDVAGRGAKAVAAEELEVATAAQWAGEQVCAMHALLPRLREALDRDGLLALFDEVEMPLTSVLSRIERTGVRVDEAKLASLSQQYETDLARIQSEIFELAGEEFLVNSPKQLQHILFEKLSLTPTKKTKTGYSTAEDVLEQLAQEHELPAKVLAWRRLAKLKSTYIDALPPLVSSVTGRIHPTFNQIGAATGRMSASDPNVQNIPIRTEEGIRIREAFVPAEGSVLVSADYSQVELRILAHYSGDASLIAAFAKGEDIHRRTAAAVAGIEPEQVDADQRARAKAVNFGIIYGSSAFGLANQLGIATGDAQATIDAYFAQYPGVRRFLDTTIAEAKERGHIETYLGRRRYLPDLNSRNRVLRQAAERMAVNSVIQGTAADLIKLAMIRVEEALGASSLEAAMILQVHDELVFEAPESELDALSELARKQMEGVFQLSVPLLVDVGSGRNWREAH
jgi:DNA polymerase-1